MFEFREVTDNPPPETGVWWTERGRGCTPEVTLKWKIRVPEDGVQGLVGLQTPWVDIPGCRSVRLKVAENVTAYECDEQPYLLTAEMMKSLDGCTNLAVWEMDVWIDSYELPQNVSGFDFFKYEYYVLSVPWGDGSEPGGSTCGGPLSGVPRCSHGDITFACTVRYRQLRAFIHVAHLDVVSSRKELEYIFLAWDGDSDSEYCSSSESSDSSDVSAPIFSLPDTLVSLLHLSSPSRPTHELSNSPNTASSTCRGGECDVGSSSSGFRVYVTDEAVSYGVGDRVFVRSNPRERWQAGTVVGMQGEQPLVRVDGAEEAAMWHHIEPYHEESKRTFFIGDLVRVRDNENEPWRCGKVTGKYKDKAVVTLDGESRGSTWNFVEVQEGESVDVDRASSYQRTEGGEGVDGESVGGHADRAPDRLGAVAERFAIGDRVRVRDGV
eukprot:Sspe_Gene.71499::Locus_42411_Transcript_1_1_Confidence_1.000_Length_1370::g.71499::m.71499